MALQSEFSDKSPDIDVTLNNSTNLQTSPNLPEKPDPAYKISDQTSALPVRKIFSVFLACAAVDFTTVYNETSLAVALPTIGSSIKARGNENWIPLSYFVTSTSFQLLYGRLSDIWSRKIVLLAGLSLFFLGSLGSSLATNLIQLILFRSITGIGGGGLETIANIIVGDVVSPRERGRWQVILGFATALANGVGPVIGGAFSSKSTEHWRWIFRLNVILTILTISAAVFFMPLKKVEGCWKRKLAAIDFVGAFISLLGSICVVLGLTWGGSYFPWDSIEVILLLVLGGFFMIAFLLWQWKGARLPLLPLHIFKYRIVIGASLTVFVNGWNYIVQMYYIPTFYQLAYGYSPVRAASVMLPIQLAQTFSSTMGGWIVTWRGRYRESIIIGYFIWAIGFGLFSTLNKSSNLAQQICYATLTGFGVGQTLQPGLIALQSSVEPENMAVATCSRHYIRYLGATFGLAVATTIVNNSIRNTLSASSHELSLSAERIKKIVENPTSVYLLHNGSNTAEVDAIQAVVSSAFFRAFRWVFYASSALAIWAMLAAIFLMPQLDLGKKGLRTEEDLQKRAAKGETQDWK